MALNVGIIGCGAVTRGIHIPTLARLGNDVRVSAVTDVSTEAAELAAHRTGARATPDVTNLLTEPDLDVVAICSPHALHAEQVIAAVRAGVRTVFCEKPLAVTDTEAHDIGRAVLDAGARLVVGAMHMSDPAWRWLGETAPALPEQISLIRSHIVLPWNARFEKWSAELDTTTPRRTPPEGATERAAALEARLLGLAIHDMPLIRSFLPSWRDLKVVHADLLSPLGYLVALRAGDRIVEIVGSFRDHWDSEWTFDVHGPHIAAGLRFTPSFVHAGSGTAFVREADAERRFPGSASNGYEEEWRSIVARAGTPSSPEEVASLVDDLSFATLVARRSARAMAREAA